MKQIWDNIWQFLQSFHIFLHGYVHFRNQFEHALVDDCIDNYMFLVDHSQNGLSPAMQLSYDHVYEEETFILDDQEMLVKA